MGQKELTKQVWDLIVDKYQETVTKKNVTSGENMA